MPCPRFPGKPGGQGPIPTVYGLRPEGFSEGAPKRGDQHQAFLPVTAPCAPSAGGPAPSPGPGPVDSSDRRRRKRRRVSSIGCSLKDASLLERHDGTSMSISSQTNPNQINFMAWRPGLDRQVRLGSHVHDPCPPGDGTRSNSFISTRHPSQLSLAKFKSRGLSPSLVPRTRDNHDWPSYK
ncbi:hypothetical protein AUP68_04656 [Ilyonectria robusta]